ncbi:TonB family C-terminal domain-containing protein [Fodinibius roseus]|uniref:TonB family C-terminal domain-containing protein n=1 Tax=Fodinibius roseus TaxID=1194090 RepID=A0A1M5AH65_9BACT|nr:energy transducer TonB [Fodinibius roseus]SHF29601.1 TonB family C-terminal domain-containing protein [Fodinibius roseus]
MELPTFQKEEDRFALMVTGGVHVALVIIFLLYSFTIQTKARPSFIEVQFGEFQSGSPAEFAEQQNEEVATRPDPSETEPENPDPDTPDPAEEQQETTEETAKQVDLADQTEEIEEEEVQTPDTDEVDPEKETATEEQQEVTVPPQTEQDEVRQEGAESSGDPQGRTGDIQSDQGTGNEQEKSAPYELRWEGDVDRAPMVQPLPENPTDLEATLTIRFEVKPDGTIGRIVPLKKMNPELEREVLQTLRSWRFSRLPSGVPQQSQWGTITFRFVLE